MGEVIEHLIENGHCKEAIINDYTIDQIWLFYNKSLLLRRKRQHEDAILFAHCTMLANPNAAKEAGDNFQKFLRTLLPEKFRKGIHDREMKQIRSPRSKASPEVHKTFQQMSTNLGVPMKVKKKSKPKLE